LAKYTFVVKFYSSAYWRHGKVVDTAKTHFCIQNWNESHITENIAINILKKHTFVTNNVNEAKNVT